MTQDAEASLETVGLSERPCPRCTVHMETVRVSTFEIERCTRCGGWFFDPAELQSLAQTAAEENLQLPDRTQGPRADESGEYLKCPVCSDFMLRRAYGVRSGVVTDWCRHGVWLDGGELSKVLAWTREGRARPAQRGTAPEGLAEHVAHLPPAEAAIASGELIAALFSIFTKDEK
jgi:Zn-finger nucleic acid-binding protein